MMGVETRHPIFVYHGFQHAAMPKSPYFARSLLGRWLPMQFHHQGAARGLPGDAIGAILITERVSLVELPEDFAADVIAALSGTKIRGRRVQLRRDRLG